MPIETVIEEIIANYWSTFWVGFVTLVATGFIMSMIRDFISDLVYYYRARMSDIGEGQRVYWHDEIYIVSNIYFKYIKIFDNKKTIRIPIKLYLNGIRAMPNHRHDDFDEEKYHQPPWDGQTERRQ